MSIEANTYDGNGENVNTNDPDATTVEMGGPAYIGKGDKGDKGDTGNGIASISKTGTSGNVDTYTVTMTDGTTSTFEVTNANIDDTAGRGDESETWSADKLAGQERKLTLLDGLLDNTAYKQETATATEYSLPVPTNAKAVRVNKYSGNSVVWNQLCQPIFASPITKRGITATVNSDLSVTFNGESTGVGFFNFTELPLNIKGHKFFMSIRGDAELPQNFCFDIEYGSSLPQLGSKIVTIGTTTKANYPTYIYSTSAGVVVNNLTLRPLYVDLTQMFGAGNEPTTINDPRIAMIEAYLAEHPEYNPGELVSAKVEEIESVAHDGVTVLDSYQLPAALLALPGYGCSIGDLRNEIDFVNKRYIQRVGQVDMGSLTWNYISSRYFNSDSLTGLIKHGTGTIVENLLCTKYTTDTAAHVSNHTNDNIIGSVYSRDTDIDRIWVYDSSYGNVTQEKSNQFKLDVSGVMLNYELATPVTTDISDLLPDDENFNLLFVKGNGLALTDSTGSLVFRQENDTQLSVPNTVQWTENGLMTPKILKNVFNDGRTDIAKADTVVKTIRVGSYNVRKFALANKRIWAYPEKIANIKKFLFHARLDYLGIQEYYGTLDGETFNTFPLIFADIFTECVPDSGYSRVLASTGGAIAGSSTYYGLETITPLLETGYTASMKRGFAYCFTQIGEDILLVVSAHPMNSLYDNPYATGATKGPVEERAHEFEKIFEWVRTAKETEATNWKWCIICGDFNTSNINGLYPGTSKYKETNGQDFTNLTSIVDYYGFKMANGGSLGWFETFPGMGHRCLDNILISSNMRFKDIECDLGVYDALASDHLPVIAEIELFDKTFTFQHGSTSYSNRTS